MAYKDILKIVPTLQSASLAKHNYEFTKGKDKNLPKLAVKNIVGLSTIKLTSEVIDSL